MFTPKKAKDSLVICCLMVNFALEKLGLLILFPKRVIYLLKPTDNQRIVQVLRELVVLNVVGSNPTSHPPKKRESSAVAEDFLFCTLPP